MQLIFKYDIERLRSYAIDPGNNIRIEGRETYTMLSFPEVGFFNYTFYSQPLSLAKKDLSDIRSFYEDRGISHHKIIIPADCDVSHALIHSQCGYKQTATIAKTVMLAEECRAYARDERLSFEKAGPDSIADFTEIYLESFESSRPDRHKVVSNFRTLLDIGNLELLLLKHDNSYVGVNVLYKTPGESLLAGGAILPAFRNRGFHKRSLRYRLQRSFMEADARTAIAWAYKPSISLSNMLKLNMRIEEEFNVFEYDH